MLGRSRGAGTGGSDRTSQRFFSPALPWATLFWGFFRQPVPRAEEVSRLAGDAVVVPTAGQHPQGRARGFARLSGKPVPGLAFFTLAWVSPQARRSLPRRGAQVGRRAAAQAARTANAAATPQNPAAATRRPGRPQGSQPNAQAAATRPPELVRLHSTLAAWVDLSAA